MAASIVPGFDFTVNQRPTKALMTQQANSLVITGLGVAELPDTLGILGGDTSGATGTLQAGEAVGMMWVSPDGSLWVQEQSGPVIMKTYAGGWESRRYFISIEQTDGAGADRRPGIGVAGESGGNGYLEDFLRVEGAQAPTGNAPLLKSTNNPGLEDTKNGRYLGFTTETSVSEYTRWSGRGGIVLQDHDQNISASSHTTLDLMRNDIALATAGGNTPPRLMTSKASVGTAVFQHRQMAWIGHLGPGASVVTDAGGNHTIKNVYYAWNFGLQQMMRRL